MNPRRALPKTVWVLGFGSMFMDISSELVHSLLPIFMATVLGASMVTIGLIEGIAEASAAITKIFSGAISDYFRKRKLFLVLGYGLSAISKPIFPLATTIWWVFAGRFIDRIGKGIRVAPRDALVADVTPRTLRGAAYGLRQALDTVGAFIGPLLAVLLMLWLADDIASVLWIAVIPAAITVVLLTLAVQEPESLRHAAAADRTLTLKDVGQLSSRYWLVVAFGAVFTLARFSEAFLILRAEDIGIAITYAPAIMVIMNIVYALFAYPAGVMADHFSARTLLIFGLSVLVIADVILAMSEVPWLVFLGAGLWGMHMAFTQGLFAKLVADTAPVRLRGTAFGIFSLVTGVALLLASVIAGTLWSLYSASITFLAGAVFSIIALMGLLFYRPRIRTVKTVR
jgi:MFS family permease